MFMNHSLQNNEEKIDLKIFIDRYLIFLETYISFNYNISYDYWIFIQ